MNAREEWGLIAIHLVSFLSAASATVSAPNPTSTIMLGKATLEGWHYLNSLRKNQIAIDSLGTEIAGHIADKLTAVKRRYTDQDIDSEALAGARTEVEILLGELIRDNELVLAAVQSPDKFENLLSQRARGFRNKVEEQAEPFFDEILRAIAQEFISRAPGSTSFRIEAIKRLLVSVENSQTTLQNISEDQNAIRDTLCEIQDSISQRPVQPTAKPIRFGSRPMQTHNFLHRQEEETLSEAIFQFSEPRTVLVGMHGCGKSQLATEVTNQAVKNAWPLVAWINARSRENIREDILELGQLLGVDTDQQTDNSEIVLKRCLNALQSQEFTDCLLVYDNVQQSDDLLNLVPQGPGLHILATTTNRTDWEHSGWNPIQISSFKRRESIEILTTVTGDPDSDTADEIASLLGDLPLAISQAAGTIKRGKYSLDTYLQILQKRTLADSIHRQKGTDYADSVSTALWFAFEEALEQIGNKSPQLQTIARKQLNIIALLAESGVPREWLIEDQSTLEFSEEANEALTLLLEFSICQLTEDQRKIVLHRLQARVIRENWTKDSRFAQKIQEETVNLLISCSNKFFQRNLDRIERCRQSLAIADQLQAMSTQEVSHAVFEYETVGIIIFNTISTLLDLDLPRPALDLLPAACLFENKCKKNGRLLNAIRLEIASAFREAGHYPTAITLLKNMIGVLQVNQSEDPLALLSVRQQLATTYRYAKQFDKAIPEHESIVNDTQNLLGQQSIGALIAHRELALTYLEAGHHRIAIEILEELIQDSQNFCGKNHEITLEVHKQLADAYLKIDRYDDATQQLETAIEISTNLDGIDCKITTLEAQTHLAYICIHGQKNFKKAIEILKKTTVQLEQILGSTANSTLFAYELLGEAYIKIGAPERAEALSKDIVHRTNNTVGLNHVKTLRAIALFSLSKWALGEQEIAQRIITWVIKKTSDIYGATNSATLDMIKMRELMLNDA